MLNNFYTTVSYLFSAEQSTVLTILAALIAILQNIFWKKDNWVTILTVYFLGGILFLSAFCAGGIFYLGSGYSDRYILPFAFPFVFLAAKGVINLAATVQSRLLWGAFFVVLGMNSLFSLRHLAVITKNNPYNKKVLLLQRVAQVVPNEAYIIEECAALVTAKTSKRSIQTMLFLRGDNPKKVVFLKGLTDFTDMQRTFLVADILNARYSCSPLVVRPFMNGKLSVQPLLCVQK